VWEKWPVIYKEGSELMGAVSTEWEPMALKRAGLSDKKRGET
jgi:hypothetical protein